MPVTEFDPSRSVILVDMELTSSDGSGTLLFPVALDTGATFTTIPWDIAIDLGYDPAHPERRQRIFTGSGVELCPVVTCEKDDCFRHDGRKY